MPNKTAKSHSRYCPRVAAVSHTQKHTKTRVTLTFVRAQFHQAISAAVHELLC